MRPEIDNHWALRDFAARLMAQICKNFNTSTNNLQTRVTRLFSAALTSDKTPLSSMYGALEGLSELGTEVIKVFIIPRLRFISERVEVLLQGTTTISNTDKIAAGHIRAMLQKAVPPVLKTLRNPPDLVEEYKRDYGCLGPTFHQGVVKARSASPSAAGATSSSASTAAPPTGSSTPSAGTAGSTLTSASPVPSAIVIGGNPSRPQTPQIVAQSKTITAATSAIQRQTLAGASGVLVSTGASSQSQPQKFVIVPQQRTKSPSPSPGKCDAILLATSKLTFGLARSHYLSADKSQTQKSSPSFVSFSFFSFMFRSISGLLHSLLTSRRLCRYYPAAQSPNIIQRDPHRDGRKRINRQYDDQAGTVIDERGDRKYIGRGQHREHHEPSEGPHHQPGTRRSGHVGQYYSDELLLHDR